tara:strand:- start:15 stop:263 length:249 start_codon:yes stop_codon:yes gene_type:complete
MGYEDEMEDFYDEEEFNKKKLEQLKKEILDEAKKVVENYVDNPSDISGSVVNIHENSPFLDADKNGEPAFSGSRWTKLIKSK